MWLLKESLALVFCFGSPRVFAILAWALGFVFSPLLLLDPFLLKLKLADGLAGDFYYIARQAASGSPASTRITTP